MVKLNKIYTKTGDAGTTGLETNAAIGMVRIHLAGHPGLDAKLGRVQNDLFDLGADLCVPDRGKKPEFEVLRVSDDQVARLEAEIDEMNSELKPLKSFVLPGGSPASAALHVARTVCRRAEREMVALAAQEGEPVNPAALKYINRLSDFLFVAGRYVNDRGRSDVLWVPGQNR
jgi:cob(I)alamin adenosyltransferase